MCNCKEGFDIRCMCDPPNYIEFPKNGYHENYKGNTPAQFRDCPMRIGNMVWFIGNTYEWYKMAIKNNFTFLNGILPLLEHREVIKQWKEEQED